MKLNEDLFTFKVTTLRLILVNQRQKLLREFTSNEKWISLRGRNNSVAMATTRFRPDQGVK